MSDTSQGPGWWIASDAKWYPPTPNTPLHDFDDENGPVAAHRHPNGGGWIADTATVATSAFVGPEAEVFQFAKVLDNAIVSETSWVLGSARVTDHARISGDSEVSGSAQVANHAEISGSAYITDNARVLGSAHVGGTAKCVESCTISENARVFGSAVFSGDVVFTGDNSVPQPEGSTSRPITETPRLGGWQASDGIWHPPPGLVSTEMASGWSNTGRRNLYAFATFLRTKGRRIYLYASATLLVVLLAIILLIGVLSVSKGSTEVPSLSDLTSNVQGQITGTGPGNYNVSGVSRVVCNPPKSWSPGEIFICYAYASDRSGLGIYTGTVEPNTQSGNLQWNATWLP